MSILSTVACKTIDELKETLDDLRSQPEGQTTITEISKTLCELAYAVHRSDPTEAEVYTSEALVFAEKVKYTKGIAECHTLQGTLAWLKSDYIRAVECYSRALKVCEETGNMKGCAGCYSNLANIRRNQGNYERALELHFKSLRIKEEINDRVGMAKSYNNIGIIYDEWKEHGSALEFYNKALQMFEELGDNQGIAISYNNIGIIFEAQGDYQRATEEYRKSLEIKEGIGDRKGTGNSYINIGTLCETQGDYDGALEYFVKALDIFEEIGDRSGIADSKNHIGRIYSRLEQFDEALVYLQEGLELSREIGSKDRETDSCRFLFEFYKAQDAFEDALYYHMKYTELREEIFNDSTAEKIVQMQVRYETDSIEKEAEIYRSVFENTMVGFYRITPEGRILMANTALAGILGFSSYDELLNSNLHDWRRDTTHPSLVFFHNTDEENQILRFESEWLRQDKAVIHIRENCRVVRDESGNILYYEGTVEDITNLKQADIDREKLLHDIEERVKKLDCLYSLSRLAEKQETELRTIFQGLVELIPPAWQNPGDTCARIIFEDLEYESARFRETRWKQEAPILIDGEKRGLIQVFYLKEFPISFEGPFQREERHLINELADRIGNIIHRKQAVELLAGERRRLSYILEGTNVGTWEWNVQTGVTSFNERWAEIIGYTLEELSPVSIETWMEYCHPDDLKISDRIMKRHFARELDYYECEVRMRHKIGAWVWILNRGKVISWADDKTPLLMAGTHEDITSRKLSESRVQHLATHDALTELPTMRLAMDRMSMTLEVARRNGTMVAVMFIDLDDFKLINDRYGHLAGDILLKVVAERFLSSVRKVDTVARIGGDEFLLILSGLRSQSDVAQIAENIVKTTAQPVPFDGEQLTTGASIGISIFPDNGENADILIKLADTAMYIVKDSGKNGYTFS